MMGSNQQPAFGSQKITVKHCLQECPQWRENKRKCNIEGDIKALLGTDYRMTSIKYLREIDMLKKYKLFR